MDTRVDAGILGIGASQAPGDDAAELASVDDPAARVPSAAVPARGAGTEGAGGQSLPIAVGPLADRLADQLDSHSAQLVRGTGVAIAGDAPAGDAHVVAGVPLHRAQRDRGDPAASESTLQPDHAHVPVEAGAAVAAVDPVLGHPPNYARLAELADAALDRDPSRLVATEAVGRRDHVHAAHQGAAAGESSIVAEVHHEATHGGQRGGGAAHDAGLDALSPCSMED